MNSNNNSFSFLKINQTDKLPEAIGVYAFWTDKKPIYIGKAVNIKKRVKDHLSLRGYKDSFLIKKAKKIGYIKTNSEIASLILEASLIKEYKPKYNVAFKDDKNYFYVIITKDEFPKVFIGHQTKQKGFRYIGPFVDGNSLKRTLYFLRKVFPYYTKNHEKKNCQWCELNMCPGPNPDRKKYLENIKNLIKVLEGKNKSVISWLEKKMLELAKKMDFEGAAKIRDQIQSLKNIMENARVISSTQNEEWIDWPKIEKNLRDIIKTKERISRIESFDISNIQGKYAVGAMVVFINGLKNKNEYRKFKVKYYTKGPNDIEMLKEIINRRLKHKEWPLPEIIMVDGGKNHFKLVENILRNNKLKIKCLAVTKDEKHKGVKIYISDKKPPIYLKDLSEELKNFIIKINEETHRFAVSYYNQLRIKDIDLKEVK
jgi:excinuclease ABC subunit C